MSSEDVPPPPQAARKHAWIHVENKTSDIFKVQIVHKYTGESIEDSKIVQLNPGEDKSVLKVTYNVGIFTTGVDNWKVKAYKLVENGKKDEDGNKLYDVENWRTGHSAGDDWKKHTLRSEDHDRVTTIRIKKDEVEFDSPSGTSTSEFKKGSYDD
ncbi:hypothetical protein CAEBREN_21427 [Caenorhabditis brenneri]|uniref:Up-regulated in Daf-2 domain-containing protein n=1 Tax=Caenorhabditis brenneri TaxID=135651 RepID=G0PG24_CAEBE|nr:hypothetical protein CAEBREN_21427 [Caenorhabditis brenneri]